MGDYDAVAWLRAGRPRWVLVAIVGPGVGEDIRVYGPWRSKATAERARDRLDKATEWQEGDSRVVSAVAELDPEHGGPFSLAALVRDQGERGRSVPASPDTTGEATDAH